MLAKVNLLLQTVLVLLFSRVHLVVLPITVSFIQFMFVIIVILKRLIQLCRIQSVYRLLQILLSRFVYGFVHFINFLLLLYAVCLFHTWNTQLVY